MTGVILLVVNTFLFFYIYFPPVRAVGYLSQSIQDVEKALPITDKLYNVSRYINENVLKDNRTVKILSFHDSRVGYINDSDVTTIPDLYGASFAVLAYEEGDVEKIYERLKKEGITHILVAEELIRNFEFAASRASSIYYDNLNPKYNTVAEDLAVLKQLLKKHGKQMYCVPSEEEDFCAYSFFELNY